MATKPRQFRNITADFYQFDQEGKSLEGTLLAKDTMTFHRAGIATDEGKYTIQNDAGERISFLGGTELDQTLATVDVGSYIRVTYTGERKASSGMMVKQFAVELAE
jgi:hypothetical protein